MQIGITGAFGFIGWHLRCYLKTLDNISEVRVAGRDTFNNEEKLSGFIQDLDIIFHLAGVNRATDEELLTGNIKPANQLVNALKNTHSKACVVFSSSTYAENSTNSYGHGKADATQVLASWAEESNGRFVNAIIPHVFGEYGKPFYNSAMATFCHQIANDEELNINGDGQLELIHVQDLVEQLLDFAKDKTVTGDVRVSGTPIGVADAANRLQALYEEYVTNNRLPDLKDSFDRSLFNTLRGAIPEANRVVSPIKHEDNRGWLVETVKVGSGGQCFVSTTMPGITRGNHFHRRKVERFFVLKGKGSIQLRKLFSDEVITYDLDGDTPSYVDIPTLHTHAITNTGEDELITLFWADEFFDPEKPDTYFEPVIKENG